MENHRDKAMAVRAAMDGTGAEVAVFVSPAALAHFGVPEALAVVITASGVQVLRAWEDAGLRAGLRLGCEGPQVPAGLDVAPDAVIDLSPHLAWCRVTRPS